MENRTKVILLTVIAIIVGCMYYKSKPNNNSNNVEQEVVVEPVVIAAVWEGHGSPGSSCEVLLSPCLLQAIPFTNTFGDPSALVIPEQ